MLSDKKLQDIRKLQQLCEAADQCTLKLNWDMLRSRKQDEQQDYLHYKGEQLIGFLGVYRWGNQVEICGMVRPVFRRQGIFTGLWNQAIQDLKQQSYEELLLNTSAASQAGQGFIESLTAQYHHSEYQMKWEANERMDSINSLDSRTPATVTPPAQEVTLRPATDADADAIIELDMDGFKLDEVSARQIYESIRGEDHQKQLVIAKNEATVGKITITYDSSITWIYGFVINGGLRGQGIGRIALNQVIAEESLKSNQLWIEVAVENPRALKLYESCGFVTQEQQDYYIFIG